MATIEYQAIAGTEYPPEIDDLVVMEKVQRALAGKIDEANARLFADIARMDMPVEVEMGMDGERVQRIAAIVRANAAGGIHAGLPYTQKPDESQSSAEDAAIILGRLGIDHPIEKIHASDHPLYRDVYTPEMVDIIADAYAKDIEMFGYEF